MSDKPFKLSEITQMKLKCVAWLTNEITDAESKGHIGHAEACRRELIQTKAEAMNPSLVVISL